jgi:hypothetical protein
MYAGKRKPRIPCVASCTRLIDRGWQHRSQWLRQATGTNRGLDGLLAQSLNSAGGRNVIATAGHRRFSPLLICLEKPKFIAGETEIYRWKTDVGASKTC